ncbi:MAG: hypothetical protein IKK48_00780 [Firmicutes bacterium]|nr:hypothetical protein [Bacillota bacterium]
MKKMIAIMVAVCMVGGIVFALTTCDKKEEVDLSEKVTKKITAYRTDLEDSAATLTSSDAVKKYLCNWAGSKGIDYETDDADNVILKVKASEAYKDAEPTVLVCGYDAEHLSDCIDPISVALYVAKNNEATGKLTVIFTEDEGHAFNGIKELDATYFTNDSNVFVLNGGAKNMWSTTTAGNSTYTFNSTVERTEPKGNKAYQISINGLPGGIPDEKIASYPNPIKELGDLLAYFKTNSVIYELGKINGGTSGSLYPKEASCVIVIDENDYEKFEKRITTAIDNFNDKYERYGATYAYEEIEVPESVLSADDMNKLISVLYTLIDGVYERDEDDNIISITNIGAIKCTNDTCTVSASGNSITEIGLNQLDLSYTTICGLSDLEYDKTSTQTGWSIKKPDENPFVQEVAEVFKEYSDGTMKYRDNIAVTNCSYIYDMNPNCDLMSISVNYKRIAKYAGTLVTFMMNQNVVE